MPSGSPRIGRATAIVTVIALAITAALTFAAQRAHDTNEDRLLAQQAEEARPVLPPSVPRILSDVAEVARVVELLDGDTAAMQQELQGDIDEDSFTSITVLRRTGAEPEVELGAPTALDRDDVTEMLQRVRPDPDLVHVSAFLEGDDRRLAYGTDTIRAVDKIVGPGRARRGPAHLHHPGPADRGTAHEPHGALR